MDWISLTARGNIPAGISSAPISKSRSTRWSGFAESLADLGIEAERLASFLAEIIGTPPVGSAAILAACRLYRQDAGATCGVKNVGAPTLKVLLEGLWKEFVFSGIGGLTDMSFQNGNRAA